MANNNNLIPLNKRTKSEQREIAKSGGVASGIARNEKRRMKDILTELLNCKTQEGISTKEALGIALINQCLDGNVRAFETLMCMIGEKPVDEDLNNYTTQQLQKKMEAIRLKLLSRGEGELPAPIIIDDIKEFFDYKSGKKKSFNIVVANEEVKQALEDI